MEEMIPVELGSPLQRRYLYEEIQHDEDAMVELDLIVKNREYAQLREFAAKQQAAKLFNNKVSPRSFKKGNQCLKR